jgi:hypothetical protein
MAGPAGRDGSAAPLVRAAPGDPGAARPDPSTVQLVRDCTWEWQRLEELLEGALVKLSQARVKPARIILEALAAGERGPHMLAGLALGSLQGSRSELEETLEGMMLAGHHARLIRIRLDHIAFLDHPIAAVETAATVQQRSGRKFLARYSSDRWHLGSGTPMECNSPTSVAVHQVI